MDDTPADAATSGDTIRHEPDGQDMNHAGMPPCLPKIKGVLQPEPVLASGFPNVISSRSAISGVTVPRPFSTLDSVFRLTPRWWAVSVTDRPSPRYS